MVNGGLFGCGLVIGTSVSNAPPKPELAMFPDCNAATPVSSQWPAVDSRVVADTAPGDVVLFLAGTWETQDILRNGRWMYIGEPSYQRYISQMRLAVEIGTEHGAHFVFATMPALAAGAAQHAESTYPENASDAPSDLQPPVRRWRPKSPASQRDRLRRSLPPGVFTEHLDGVQ